MHHKDSLIPRTSHRHMLGQQTEPDLQFTVNSYPCGKVPAQIWVGSGLLSLLVLAACGSDQDTGVKRGHEGEVGSRSGGAAVAPAAPVT